MGPAAVTRGMQHRLLATLLFCCAAGSAAAEEAWQARWDATLAAARKEAAITVSGPPGSVQRDAIAKAWEASFPDIRLDYTGARGSAIAGKVTRERAAGLYHWDIILASTGPVVFNLIPIDALAPLRDALIRPELAEDRTWIGGFASGFIDKGKIYYFNPMGSAGLPLGYVNRACLSKEQFSTAEDMKRPELQAKIVWFDPTGNEGGIVGPTSWVLALSKGEDWLKDLFQNHGVAFARDYRQMADWLFSCTKPVAWGIDNAVIDQMQAAGLGREVEKINGAAFSGSINPGGPRGNHSIGWYNNAPHPNAAKIFVNWYLSQDFQAYYAQSMHDNSRRADVSPGDPAYAMQPDVQYLNWIDEEATVKIRALQENIKSWHVVQ
jgi:iron(III) transport system substrate-binding protein